MIKIENLNKSFGDKKIIKDFNCNFNEKSMTAITGKSGCGKTTLLNIIGLLDLDFDGTVLYDNVQVSIKKEKERNKFIRNNINYLFQNYALIDSETVYDNLLLALEYEKISKTEKKKRIDEALKMVDLNDYSEKKVYTLSGGEQQRVALARIILKTGNIILADEPTGNLDKENSERVMKVLKTFRDNGKTIIIVTHDENIANQCDNVIRW